MGKFPLFTVIIWTFYACDIVDADCSNGFIRHDDSCYRLFISVRATWIEAMMYCKLFDSHLAVIETSREQNFLEGMLIRESTGGVETTFVWIGGTDALVEGEWQWIPSGEQILDGAVFTSWQPGEPNSLGRLGEDCLNMDKDYGFKWNDSNCGNHYNFVCEKRKE